MFRFGYKYLLVSLLLLTGSVSLGAYYYTPDNQPPGAPPNYNQIDPDYFYGVPALDQLSSTELDGHFIYYDTTEKRWSILRAIPFSTEAYEQFHGSILVQLAEEPSPGVNVWPLGFDLSEDLHRNDRWGWVKWPDSIAPNLYEIWWDITLECPEPYVPCTRTIGFWKNHSGMGPQDDLVTQYLPIWLGTPDGPKSVNVTDAAMAFDILSQVITVGSLDGITKLRAQLLAAKLDIASGTDGTVVAEVIDLADAFLADHEPADWSSLDEATRQMVLDWKDTLDQYNNGIIGPGHEDDGSLVIDCSDGNCPPCVVGISFNGCAFDFNLWGSSYNETYGPEIIYLGEQRIPLAEVPEYMDTFEGIDDPYGHPFDCVTLTDFNMAASALECLEPNLSVFTPVMFPGAAYNVDGLISTGDEYGDTYAGSRVYEGNGIQFALDDCGENNPPEFDPPVGSLKPLAICLGQTIYDTIVVNDYDPDEYVTLTKLSGPGDFTSTPGSPPVYGYLTWTPTETGSYTVIFEATDSRGASLVDSIVYNITYNELPEILVSDTTFNFCWGLEPVCLTIPVSDTEGDSLTFNLLSGSGTLDPVTGELCFTPEAAGEYPFEVEVSDICGSDTASFIVTITENSDPWIEPYDSLVSLCEIDSICFDVNAYDPDLEDSLEIILLDGPGIFNQTASGMGRHCFLPDSVDSARYVFHYAVTDECWREVGKSAETPPTPPHDSIIIVVIIDQPPVISCPDGPVVKSLCGPDTVCVDIAVEPASSYIEVLEEGAVYENGKLCFYAETTGTYDFTMVASNECGADTCIVTFDVTVEDVPQVTCPESDSVHLCEADYISVPLGVYPADASLTIIPEAEYADGMLTFYADAPGNYAFSVIAENGCGIDSCAFDIEVTFDSPPMVSISDSTVFLCELEQICIPFTYDDPDGNISRVIVQPVGYQKVNDSVVCFTPPYAGEYPIIVSVVDSCQNYVADTAMITVLINEEPSISIPDSSFFVCEPSEVCLPVSVFDPDGNLDYVEVAEPAYYDADNMQVCLPVLESGDYQIIATVYDDCGLAAVDTATVNVNFDVVPKIYCPPSGSMHLCGPDSISVPLTITPASAEFEISPGASYSNGMLTFYADQPGRYCFDVSASNTCGEDSCSFCIDVTFDSAPTVTIADSIVYQCDYEEICLPYSFSDPDGNVVSVTVGNLKDYFDPSQSEGEVCFMPWRPGLNELIITVTDDCGLTDTDTATVVLVLNQEPQASLSHQTFYLCEPGDICMPLTMSDPDGVIDSVVAMPPAYYDAENQQVCMPISATGLYQVTATVYDDCGASTIATAVARVIVNYDPVVTAPPDTSVFLCDLTEICLTGFEIKDRNQNLSSIEFIPDIGTYADGRYCFMPEGEGEYCIIVRATDSCGVSDEDTVCVTVELGDDVQITCPDGVQPRYLCGPDSACVEIPVTPANAEVMIVEPGAIYENGKLCFYAEQEGIYSYTLIAEGECGADTCVVEVDVTIDEAPQITCPPSDTMHLCGPDTIAVPLAYSPSEAQLSIMPEAVYEEGMLKFFAAEPGDYCFDVTAENRCGIDTCNFCITVTFDSPPVAEANDDSLYLCQTEEVCVEVGYSDIDDNIASVTVEPEFFSLADNKVCFTPSQPGEYQYVLTVTDTCGNTAVDTGLITITMNLGPTVTVGDDSFFLCEAADICLPINISDPDGVIDSVIVSDPWNYDAENNLVCRSTTGSEQNAIYEVNVTVYDDCGVSATDDGTARVTVNTGPSVILPRDDSLFLCQPEQICLPVEIADTDTNISSLEVTPPEYELVDGQICFTPDTAGTYQIIVTATDTCGLSASDTVNYEIDINQGPSLAIADTTLFDCAPVEVCLPVTMSDPDGTISVVDLTEPWIYNPENGEICAEISVSGSYEVIMTIADDCGEQVTDTALAEVTINTPPYMSIPADTTIFECESTEICLSGFSFGDAEGNISTIEFTPDLGTYTDGTYCFTPQDTAGSVCFVVRVTDECGEMAEDTVCVDYSFGEDVTIACPEGPVVDTMCAPREVCVPIPIEPADAIISVVEPEADYAEGSLCFTPPEPGVYNFTLIAAGDCDVDTCKVTFDITFEDAPVVTCPVDTALHLCDPDTITLPLGVNPALAEVTVTPEAVYADGNISFFAGQPGDYCFEVIAANECGADTCNFCVTVTIDSPPVVSIADSSLFLCSLEEICLPYEYSDPDDNVVSVTVGPNKYELVDGYVCFTPTEAGIEEIYLTVTDSCGHSATDTATVNITLNEQPLVTAGDTSVFLCDPAELCVPVTMSDADGSIDSVVVSEPAYYNAETGTVCLYADTSGYHQVAVTVYDDCGAAATDTATFTVRYNFRPMVDAPKDTAVTWCDTMEICIDGFTVIDIDRNLESIEFIPALGTYENGTYCFTATEPGDYCFVIRATDTCGAIGEDSLCVSVEAGSYASLNCPDGIQYASICQPDTICIDMPVQPLDASVRVVEEGGVYRDGQLCFYAGQSGEYTFTVIAEADCNADTCVVTTDVSIGEVPAITCPESVSEHLCGPDSISVPLAVSGPVLDLIVNPEASWSDNMLTFYAGAEGEYCFEVIAAGECGSDTCNFCITVTFDDPPVVAATDTALTLCAIEEVCIPVEYSDADNNIDIVDVSPAEFTLVDNAVCFTPPDEGSYQYIVTVTDSCGNQAVDTGTIDITLNIGPSVAVADSNVFLCGSEDVCLEVTMSDPDGVIDSVVVSEPGYYDSDNQLVCLSAETPGTYDIVVTVYDDCGESATDTGTAVVEINSGPGVEFGDYQADLTLCEITEICLPLTIIDPDENIDSIYWFSNCGSEFFLNAAQDSICWLPNEFGTYTLTVIVEDECGEADTAVAEVRATEAPQPAPPCPGDTTIWVCEPGQVCLDLGEVQPGSNIKIRPSFYSYVPDLQQLCYFAESDRTDTVTVIDSTECGIDSCQFVLTTVMNGAPVVAGEAPEEIEFCHLTQLCIDFTVTDPDGNLDTVMLGGNCPDAVLDIANNQVCLEITTALDCAVEVIGIDICGAADTLVLPIVAVPNRPPVISLPEIETVVRCEDDTDPIVITEFCVTDPDMDELTMIKDSGLGEFSFDPVYNCGVLTFTPPTNDTAQYCFRFMATDQCDTVYETYCLNVLTALVCSTCVEVWIEDPGCVNSGQVTEIDIRAESFNDIAAYDMLISYDATAITFLRADIGDAIEGWEYFTYRFGDLGNCEAPCPSGLIRLVGIADINNGPFHPPVEQLHPDGNLASITFRVSNDLNLGGQNIPIEFFWMDCGDNGFSDPSGQYLYLDYIIYSPEGNIVWDEFNEDAYPESSRIPHVGAPDECLDGDKFEPIRCVSFHNGELCITHPDSVDARGDLNLNGVPYEIADAVVYTNYFISGMRAFTISPAGQIAASDVNADGMTLSVADLVYLIRVIIGDANPYPKPIINGEPVIGSCTRSGSEIGVTLASNYDIGAALMVFDCDRRDIGEVRLAYENEHMEIKSGWLDGQLRVLVYSFEPGSKIEAGRTDVINIAVPEDCHLELAELELADYYGRALSSEIGNKIIPNRLDLTQNYPNPFNPRTSFELALPVASDYSVTIYNVTGQVIRRWQGYSEAGYIRFEWDGCDDNGASVASGIYFYRAQAAGNEAIRKMILLK